MRRIVEAVLISDTCQICWNMAEHASCFLEGEAVGAHSPVPEQGVGMGFQCSFVAHGRNWIPIPDSVLRKGHMRLSILNCSSPF